ncbi:MAG: MFS transporter [Roseiflexaceae bacterium]
MAQSQTLPHTLIAREREPWLLFAAIMASSMAFIDSSALNVALPALQADLKASGADLLWIVNSYALLLAALILVGGALGDRFGRKRMFMLGIGLFAGTSVLCGLAPDATTLIVARALKGIAGALMVPGSLSLIAALVPPERRGQAIGAWSAFSTITTILGPALGGLLAGAGLWRVIFFINLPLALLALAALQRGVPESRDPEEGGVDIPGALLVTLGLVGLTYGSITAAERGLTSDVLVALVGGVLALIGFVLVEARSPHPMLPLSMFRSRAFSGTNAMTLFLYAALGGALFFMPLNLIQVQGYDPGLAGLSTLPFPLLLALLSRRVGALSDRLGPRIPLTVGPALAGLGFLLYALPGITAGPSDYWTTFFPAILVLGLGMAITVAPLSSTVMSSAPPELAGVASGISNAVSRAAGVLAVAIMGGLALLSFGAALEARSAPLELAPAAREALLAQASRLGEAQPPTGLTAALAEQVQQVIRLAFVDTFRLMMLIATGLSWLSALLSALVLRDRNATDG